MDTVATDTTKKWYLSTTAIVYECLSKVILAVGLLLQCNMCAEGCNITKMDLITTTQKCLHILIFACKSDLEWMFQPSHYDHLAWRREVNTTEH